MTASWRMLLTHDIEGSGLVRIPNHTHRAMKTFLLNRLPQLGLALILLGLMAYLASKQPLFLTAGTLSDIFKYYSPMAMLALGMTFIILTGGIDLSVGFVMMLLMFVMAGTIRDH